MKNISKIMMIYLFITTAIGTSETFVFNENWDFSRKSKEWKQVTLPHTANIEPYIVNDQWQGLCTYRKNFMVPQSWKGKKLFLEFEGAMTIAKVSLNGKLLTTHFGGYLPFTVDLSNGVNFGKKNLIEVELNNNDQLEVPPGKPLKKLDFCSFGGIYRNVKLHIQEQVYISNPVHANIKSGGGIFITYPEVSSEKAVISVKTHVVNETRKITSVKVRQTIFKKYKKICSKTTKSVTISKTKSDHISLNITINNPALWSPQSPELYHLVTEILVNGKTIDKRKTRFGIRRISFSDKGFLINNKKMYLRGTNRHQEYPYLGYALSDNAQYRDAVKIKEAGFDFVRLSHYPHSTAFFKACDELGILVMDCTPGWQFFKEGIFAERVKKDCREMIRRDRNHPSVIAWETSLNESHMPNTFLKELHKIVDEEYPGDQSFSASFTGQYHDIFVPARQHGKGPKFWDYWSSKGKALLTAEYGDWEYYANNAANFNQAGAKELKHSDRTSRQLREAGEKRLLQQALNYQESHNQNLRGVSMVGDANWLMFDYNRGYANDIESSGIMDLMRLPKFAYYFYRSQRSPKEQSELYESGPMIFAATYWNETSNPMVRVFTNCQKVEAYLNGEKMEIKKAIADKFSDKLKFPPIYFDFEKFEPGTLVFKGIIDEKVVATQLIKTPHKPENINMSCDYSKRKFANDGADAVFVYAKITDKNGTVIPNATDELKFTCSGPVEIIGPKTVKAEAGIATILIRSTGGKGKIIVKAKHSSLLTKYLTIKN